MLKLSEVITKALEPNEDDARLAPSMSEVKDWADQAKALEEESADSLAACKAAVAMICKGCVGIEDSSCADECEFARTVNHLRAAIAKAEGKA